MDAAAVELRGCGKRFGAVVALAEVSLAIRPGEFISLLGPSGCGKSTTLNLIGGFEDATSGAVLIDGAEVTGVPPHLRPVNTVFQSYALFPHMTVEENVGFGLRMRGTPRAERRRAVERMLAMVALEGYGARRPAELSGGQRQRVALARALVNEPKVLLLDEPLGALDLKLRKQMQAELTRLQRQVGITFVYVTHDQEEAMAMSDRVAVMDRGRLLQVGTPADIYDAPQDRFVMDFIGAANALEGRVARRSGDVAAIEVPGLGALRGRVVGTLAEGDVAALLVRPEKLRLGPAGDGLPAEVARVVPMGFVAHVTLRLADGRELLAYRLNEAGAGAALPVPGQPVGLDWDENDARIFRARDDG